MIKGHTRIELTDVNTGEVEVHESDNLFTNAFKYAFCDARASVANVNKAAANNSGDPYSNSYLNLFPYKFFGGLLAFENAIEEDADNIMYPLDNKITARGSDFSYAGEELELGGLSLAETGFQDDGSYKLVWNFDTSHGNGQISSVCLTSPFGGRLGVGCSTSDTSAPYTNGEDDKNAKSDKLTDYPNWYIGSMFPDIYSAYSSEQNEKLGNPQYYYMKDTCQTLYINGDKDEMLILSRGKYCFTKDNNYSGSEFIKESGKLRINKFRYPNKKISIFDGFFMKYLGDEIIELPSEIKTQLAQNTYTYVYGGVWQDFGYIYMLLYPTYSIAIGAKFHILKINVSDYSASVITLTNTYSQEIRLDYVGNKYGSLNYICGNNDYFVFKDTVNNKLVKMSLTNSADISVLKMAGEDWITSNYFFTYDGTNLYCFNSGSQYCINLYNDGNEVKMMPTTINNLYLFRYSNNSYNFPVYETVNGKKLCIRRGYIRFNENLISYLCNVTTYDTKYKALNVNSIGTGIVNNVNKRLLYTINNLSSPVTKTSAQSMKITYTLSEVDE